MGWVLPAVTAVVLGGCRIGFEREPDGPTGGLAVVQSVANQCSPCGAVDATLPTPSATGNLLVATLYTCALADGNCPAPTLDDPVNAGWMGPIDNGGSVTEGESYLFYKCGASGGTMKVTVSNAVPGYGMSLHLHEFKNAAATGCLDATGRATGTGATAVVTTTTPVAAADELVVAFFGNNGSGGGTAYLAGTGFVRLSGSLNSVNDAGMTEVGQQTTGLSGPQTATATMTVPGATWQALIATFR